MPNEQDSSVTAADARDRLRSGIGAFASVGILIITKTRRRNAITERKHSEHERKQGRSRELYQTEEQDYPTNQSSRRKQKGGRVSSKSKHVRPTNSIVCCSYAHSMVHPPNCSIEQLLPLPLVPVPSLREISSGLCRRASINRPPTPGASEDGEKELSLREIINVKVPLLFPLLAESSKKILAPCCLASLAILSSRGSMRGVFSALVCGPSGC
jgi:hypothetical protein